MVSASSRYNSLCAQASYDERGNPPAFSQLLQRAGPQGVTELLPDPVRRSNAAVHQRRDGPIQTLLSGPGPTANPKGHHLPESLPLIRHRRSRTRRAPPDIFRNAGELFFRRLLQREGNRSEERRVGKE